MNSHTLANVFRAQRIASNPFVGNVVSGAVTGNFLAVLRLKYSLPFYINMRSVVANILDAQLFKFVNEVRWNCPVHLVHISERCLTALTSRAQAEKG